MPLMVMVLLLGLAMCKILPYSCVDGNMIANGMKDLYNDRDRIGFWTIKSIYHFIRFHRYNKEEEAVMSDFVIVIINLLMLLLPCLIFGGVFFLILVVFIVILRLFIKKSSAISTKVTQDLSQSSAQFFADIVPQLIPWETSALGDLSAALEYSSRTRRGHIHARGRLKSLKQPGQVGWLAFELRIEDFKGSMLMKSSDCEWELQFLSLTSRETPLMVDGLQLGSIHDTHQGVVLQSGEILPADSVFISIGSFM